MGTAGPDRVFDFGPVGMRWEILRSTADTGSELIEIVNVIAPGFDGPPLHIHPTAEESYAIVSGTAKVCVGGVWRTVNAGETATVPAGTPHTIRNRSGAEVRLVNVHAPALDFERFFRRLHALATTRGVGLPPKGLRSAILLSMLFTDHPREIVSVKPSRRVMKALALTGRALGYKLPQ